MSAEDRDYAIAGMAATIYAAKASVFWAAAVSKSPPMWQSFRNAAMQAAVKEARLILEFVESDEQRDDSNTTADQATWSMPAL